MNAFMIVYYSSDGETSSNQEAYFQLDNAIAEANRSAKVTLELSDEDGTYIEHNHPDASDEDNEEFCVSIMNEQGNVTDTWSVVELKFQDTQPT